MGKKNKVPDTLTTSFGIPICNDLNSQTAGERGPVLMQDVYLIGEKDNFRSGTK
ncbi:MAG TPA: hypothetical protein DDW42_08485 [Desulfobacteraceae bacterium]|nr:hypothetical protein [Desulfobacteraceae bacterium]